MMGTVSRKSGGAKLSSQPRKNIGPVSSDTTFPLPAHARESRLRSPLAVWYTIP
jgi:hypothetical protein